jgi:hypothetical protein
VLTLGITLAGYTSRRNVLDVAPFDERQSKFKTSSDW